MEQIQIDDIFATIMKDKRFRKQYLLAYLDRFVYSTTDLEYGFNADKRKKAIESLIEAFDVLWEFRDTKLSPYDIVKIGDIVNRDDGFSGFRRVNVSAGNYAEWIPIRPNQIVYSMYSLFDNYYNVWNERDVYEKEAEFHIKFMRIHPFEDGNKRTAKILLNANLIRQNYPPVIISEEETTQYYKYINDEDVRGFANFLRIRSLHELNTLMSYYKVSKKIPIQDSVVNYIQEDIKKSGNKGGRK